MRNIIISKMTECKFKKNEILLPDTEIKNIYFKGLKRTEVQERYKFIFRVLISVNAFQNKFKIISSVIISPMNLFFCELYIIE